MKRFILLTLLSPILWALTASAYVPMIREDRVWEYRGRYYHNGEEGIAYHCMKFDGTQEVKGKEYHRFVLFKSTYVHWDVDLNRHYRVELRNEPAYLLREEEGKVYALYKDEGLAVNYSPDADGTDNLSELKLYDFTLSDGDTREYPSHTGGTDDIRPYTVRVQAPVNIDGEECRVIRLEDQSYPGFELPIDFIEGVGINLNGSMASFALVFISGAGNSYYEPEFWAELNRVLDADGNVVYGDGSAPPAPKGFDENLVWTYSPNNPPLGHKRSYSYQMKFDGTTDIGGRTWHNFKTVRAWYDDYDEDEDNPVTVEMPTGDTFLIREEDRRYYVRLPKEDSGLKAPNVIWDCESEEALLADFNCEVGDSFTMLVSMLDGRLATQQYTVTDTQEILIQGQKRKVLTMDNHIKIVEGMGAIYGTFAYSDFDWNMGHQSHLPTALPDPSYNDKLIDVRTTDGTVVFTGEGSWAYAPEVFNEDWTYKYSMSSWYAPSGATIPSRYFYDMKFDGTFEFNGMTYHNFTTVDSYRVDQEIVRDDEGCTEIVPTDTVPGPTGRKFLMREKDGKYYGLIPNENLGLSGYDWWLHGVLNEPDGEVPLYDFNCRPGDKMKILTSAGQEEVGVSSVSEIEIDGNTHRILHTDNGLKIAEAIGYIDRGILPFATFTLISGAPSDNTFELPNMVIEQEFVDIRNSEGKVVFRPEMLKDEVSLSDRVFNSDYVWRYVADGMTSRTEGGREIWTRHDMDMEFKGTEEIDGTVWHRFTTTRNELIDFYYETTDGGDSRRVTVKTTPVEETMTFLIRAEGQKWFVRLPENPVFPAGDWWSIASAETELCDFGCGVGESFETLTDKGCKETLEVTSVSTASFLDTDVRVLHTDGNYEIVEGVGVLDRGMLPFIATDNATAESSAERTEVGAALGSWRLKNVTDHDRIIVFKPSSASGGGSVDGVFADSLTIRQEGNVVSAASDSDEMVTIEVVGIDGAKRKAVAGRGAATADLSTLATGVYVVRATDGHDVKTLKVIINY